MYVVKLTGSRSRTGLAGLIPSFSHVVGAAAHLLGHVERQLVLTRVVEVAVAHAFSHVCVTELKINLNKKTLPHISTHLKLRVYRGECLTHAVVSSINLHVFRGAHTGVVAQSVVARAGPADPKMSRAFVNIWK